MLRFVQVYVRGCARDEMYAYGARGTAIIVLEASYRNTMARVCDMGGAHARVGKRKKCTRSRATDPWTRGPAAGPRKQTAMFHECFKRRYNNVSAYNNNGNNNNV